MTSLHGAATERGAALERTSGGRERRAAPVTTRGKHVRVLAVLGEVESRELVVIVRAESTDDEARDRQTHERADDREPVGNEHGQHLVAEQPPLTRDEEPLG